MVNVITSACLAAIEVILFIFAIINIVKNDYKDCPGDDCDNCPFPPCKEKSKEETD